MRTFATAYLAAGIVFLAIDAVWLSLAASRLYKPLMGDMLLDEFKVMPAALFYLIYVTGIVMFAVLPALASERWTTAAMYGAFLGLFAYATYDLTNHATLRNWPLTITIVDLCWGTFVTCAAATASYFITRALVPNS